MKVLIVGLGSIAKKHMLALQRIDASIEIIALRHSKNTQNSAIPNITIIHDWNEVPKDIDFIIISNPTSEHAVTIKKAIVHNVPLFIEKPPIANLDDKDELLLLLNENNILTYCAFSLRFHPVIQWLKENINSDEVIEATSYCGSYLPDWRPNTDYRQAYSAQKELGGGVHLDLIHEIDFIIWILGFPKSVKGFVKKVSDLEIDVSDSANYFIEYPSCTATIKLNYFRRQALRTVEFVTNEKVYCADLINHTVKDENQNVLFQSEADIISIYEKQLRYFISKMKTKTLPMNNLKEAIQTLEWALNIEKL